MENRTKNANLYRKNGWNICIYITHYIYSFFNFHSNMKSLLRTIGVFLFLSLCFVDVVYMKNYLAFLCHSVFYNNNKLKGNFWLNFYLYRCQYCENNYDLCLLNLFNRNSFFLLKLEKCILNIKALKIVKNAKNILSDIQIDIYGTILCI